jgi:predicted nucleic acid-binding protein
MSKKRRVVSDTGPLISLEKLPDGYQFIRSLYDEIVIPPAVLQELIEGEFKSAQTYLTHYQIDDLLHISEVESKTTSSALVSLDRGEQEAITLALTLDLPLLIEEEAGRRIAHRLGLKISGIAGQVLRAFRTELVSSTQADQMLNALYEAGRINKRIYEDLSELLMP